MIMNNTSSLPVEAFNFQQLLGGDRAAEERVPKLWHSNLKEANMKQKYFEEMYWRTLVVDRDSKGNPPPHWYGRACSDAYKLCPDGGLDITKLLDQIKDGEQISSMLEDSLMRVQAVTWIGRLVRLKDSSLSLVLKRTLQYNQVYIIFGSDVPAILRRLDNESWHLIGEAFNIWRNGWRGGRLPLRRCDL